MHDLRPLAHTANDEESMKPAIDTVRRVYEEGGYAYLEVGGWPESPDHLALRTVTDKNKEWFGDLDISMTADFAEALGQALILAAKDKRASQSR